LFNQDQYIRFLENARNIKSKIKLEFPGKEERKWFAPPKEFGCHCGREICWITQTGDLYPCIFFGDDFIAGNIRKEKFLDLWTKAKNMVKLPSNEICNSCLDFKKCRGGCRARALSEYKDINAVDPFCHLRKK
jgi:radical SAM protein with 4Fe4S-binding SPASM domain